MRNRRSHVCGIGLCVLVVLGGLLVGCAPGDQDNATANTLDIHMTVTDPAPAPPNGTTPEAIGVTVVLFSDQSDGQTRIYANQLTHGETFVCDGVSLIRDGSLAYTFVGRIPLDPTIAPALSCVYTRDGTATRVTILAPPHPAIAAPIAQADLPATQDVLIRYTPAPPAPTVIAINGTQLLTVAPRFDTAIIPASVMAQVRQSERYLLTVSQTSTLNPVSPFNDVSVIYTASTTESVRYS